MAIVLKAKLDKSTKRQYRYKIEKNEHGVSGSLYLAQESVGKNPKKTLKIKVKLKTKT
jgi:hypothetical protein